MNPLAWLLSSIAFSLIGTMGVIVLRKVLRRPVILRITIWSVIVTSLLLPFAFTPFESAHTDTTHHTASSIGEFCHCQNPNAGDHLRYQANSLYDFLLQHHGEVFLASLLLGLMAFMPFAVRSARTLRTLRKAESTRLKRNGLRYHIVRDLKGMPVGAVGLMRNYLHWRSEMDALPEGLRMAIVVHEEAHLRQLHTWERVALALLGILWWMNPAWHMLRRELQLQAEFAADEAAAKSLGDRKAYATLLLQLASQRSHPLMPAFAQKSLTGKRIRHLLSDRHAPFWLRMGLPLFALSFMATGDALAGMAIQRSWEKVEVYEVMNRTHRATGEVAFCRSCAFEKAAAECRE